MIPATEPCRPVRSRKQNIPTRNVSMTLFVIATVKEFGVHSSRLLVNMDWRHLIVNGENLAEYADLPAAEGKLGRQHANDGWGTFDDVNVICTNFFLHAPELAMVLRDLDHGS